MQHPLALMSSEIPLFSIQSLRLHQAAKCDSRFEGLNDTLTHSLNQCSGTFTELQSYNVSFNLRTSAGGWAGQ